MKKAGLFIFFVVLVSIVIGTLLFLFTGDLSFIIQDKKVTTTTTNSKTISLENSMEIFIKTSSINIKVTAEDRNDVKINLVNSKDSILTNTEDNKLYITTSPISKVNSFFNFGQSAQLDIILPKSYSDTLSVTSSSGNIALNNMTLSSLLCVASSGNLTLKELITGTLSCNSTSGNINSSNITTVDSSFKSSSGNISLKEFLGNVLTSTSSGDTRVSFKKFNNNFTGNSSSGNMNLTLPKDSEFYLDAASSSGNISCGFPIEVKDSYKKSTLSGTVKNDRNKIYIRTSSGDIGINH